jgi:hypothetical protein
MRKQLVCIDPGMSGAMAYFDNDEIVRAENMPPTMPDLVDKLRELAIAHPSIHCVVERVGGYVPGNSCPAAVKFGRHCGNIEATLYALGIPTTQVAPSVWMKRLGTFPKEKKDRKNAIKAMMATQYPHLKVTRKNADALGILTVEVNRG